MYGMMCKILTTIHFFLTYFFFFNQKTAYEMRISDWSSDVCSSDLRRRHPPACRRPAHDHTGAAGSPDTVPARTAPAPRSPPPPGPPAAQIGRASCRERVCQYV